MSYIASTTPHNRLEQNRTEQNNISHHNTKQHCASHSIRTHQNASEQNINCSALAESCTPHRKQHTHTHSLSLLFSLLCVTMSCFLGFMLFETHMKSIRAHVLSTNPLFLRVLLRCSQWAVARGFSLWCVRFPSLIIPGPLWNSHTNNACLLLSLSCV